jgi:hypothetical protein
MKFPSLLLVFSSSVRPLSAAAPPAAIYFGRISHAVAACEFLRSAASGLDRIVRVDPRFDWRNPMAAAMDAPWRLASVARST